MANIWRIFSDLMPAEPMLVGTVLAHFDDDYSTIEMPGGGVIRARGTGVAIGDKAFVQGGEVRGEAPDLTFYEVTV